MEEHYGVDFRHHVDNIMHVIFSDPDTEIMIVDGLDSICEACPKVLEKCKKTLLDTHTLVMKYMDFRMYETYSAQEVIKKLSR